MIEVERLSKSYGAFRAVSDVSFHVEQGEVVGFLGPNGAGKSTTLRMIAGFLGPTKGRVRIAGIDMADEPLLARKKLGYMPETSPLYGEMRVREYLTFRAELKRLSGKNAAREAAKCAEEAGVSDVYEVLIRHLSKGYRQRVGLADALLGDPPVLVLDEPTAGLDPNQIREVRALVRRRGEKQAVLLSTHILSEVEVTCSRAVVIAEGRVVAAGSIDDLREMQKASGARLVVRGDTSLALSILKKTEGIASAKIVTEDAQAPSSERSAASTIAIAYQAGADAAETTERVVAGIVGAGLFVREVSPSAASLEEVFSKLTRTDEARDTREKGASA